MASDSQEDEKIAQEKINSVTTMALYNYTIVVDIENDTYEMTLGTGSGNSSNFIFEQATYSGLEKFLRAQVREDYRDRVAAVSSLEALRSISGRIGMVNSCEYPSIWPGVEQVQWHEADVFRGIDDAGRIYITIVGRNVTEKHSQDEAIEHFLMQSLKRPEDRPSIIEMLSMIGTYFDADRAYIFEENDDRTLISNTSEWCAEGVEPEKDVLQEISAQAIAPWKDAMKRHGTFYLNVNDEYLKNEPIISEILKPQNITGIMAAPLTMEGEIVGFLGLDNPRKHTGNELYLSVVASSIYKDILLAREREKLLFKNQVVASLSHAYFCIYYVDLATGQYEELDTAKVQEVSEAVRKSGDAKKAFKSMEEHLVLPEYRQEIHEFTNIDTLADRLSNRESIGIHFNGPHVGWCEGLFVSVLRNEQGRCTRALWVVRSIKEEKEKDEAYTRELKRANAAKSEFLARMSHDIRTPLNGIIGLLEIDEMHPDDFKLLTDNRRKAKVAADHLLSLISDVLELSKLEDGNVKLADEPFDIVNLAKDVMTISDMRASESGITLISDEFSPDFNYRYVYGSPLHIRQILINIIGNAVKYNRPGGSISCKTEMVSVDDKNVTYRAIISDTGIGMSEEFMEHIFEPFAQESSDARSTFHGTGLGMSIVKSLVDKMNGTIDVKSKSGVGSTFVVTIPFKLASKEDIPEVKSAENSDLTGLKILLVEDNELNMEIAQTILVETGAIVTKAANGEDALNIFSSSPAGTFNVILMDLMMPVMNGFEATAAIRHIGRDDARTIPIIAMTANAFAEDVEKCLEAGMNGHIAKPFSVEKLYSTLSFIKK